MLSKIRSGVTYANVMATAAVFLALGGGAYAAFTLPRKSVGTPQLKRNAVTSSKVKNRSLRRRDFRPGQLPRGARGPQGERGPRGVPGPAGPRGAAAAWGYVRSNGNLTRSDGSSTVTHPAGGVYCITTPGRAARATGVVAGLEANSTPGAHVVWRAKSAACSGGLEVDTFTRSANTSTGAFEKAPADQPFFYVVP